MNLMKRIVLILFFFIFSIGLHAQSIVGAWESYYTSKDGENLRSVVIFSEKHQVATTYHATTGEFKNTNGGTWSLSGDTMTEKIEFDSQNPDRVGTEVTFAVVATETTLSIVGNENQFKRIDNGQPGKLKGAWLMSGRIRNGETQNRDMESPRKTMKILSGTRFQWIAYNTDTKEFMGTGGGTYTTIDGTYTENIEFFSRDNSRAGAALQFNYEIVDGNWHHSGLSSKGDPIHEIWSLRK